MCMPGRKEHFVTTLSVNCSAPLTRVYIVRLNMNGNIQTAVQRHMYLVSSPALGVCDEASRETLDSGFVAGEVETGVGMCSSDKLLLRVGVRTTEDMLRNVCCPFVDSAFALGLGDKGFKPVEESSFFVCSEKSVKCVWGFCGVLEACETTDN